jgi:hypothetical protein
MKTKKQEKLIKLLREWFTESEFDKKNFWHRDKVARILKAELDYIGRWRRKRPNSKSETLMAQIRSTGMRNKHVANKEDSKTTVKKLLAQRKK